MVIGRNGLSILHAQWLVAMELTLVTDPVYFMIQTHTALFVTVLPMRRTHVKQRCAQVT